MPFFKYVCETCGEEVDKYMSMADKALELPCICGSTLQRQFPNSFPKVNLKGYNWSGKAIKENAYRKKRHKKMREVTKTHVNPGTLTPNYKGNVCGSWEEAATLAKQDGANTSAFEKKIKAG